MKTSSQRGDTLEGLDRQGILPYSCRITATHGRKGEMAMFTILGWIIFGLIVGAVAKLMMPGRDPGGIIVTILLGIVGALLGGFLGRAVGLYGPGEAAGLVMSVIGAIILLVLYRLLVARRT
jgi:uncharacterized membrane protein YeaQ/YmgE (transglycosylase-associated protein family)